MNGDRQVSVPSTGTETEATTDTADAVARQLAHQRKRRAKEQEIEAAVSQIEFGRGE